MKSQALLCLAVVALFACARIPTTVQQPGDSKAQPFAFLKFEGHQLISTHEIRMTIEQPQGFRAAGPVSYLPTFSSHPYAVSLAAFLGSNAFVMMHAERVLDGSGASNYSHLESFRLGAIEYKSKVQCADLTMADVAGEHDLNFLASNAFAPIPAIYIRQFFRTTDDHNTEIVITYGERLPSCSDSNLTPSFITAFNGRLQQTIHVH